MKSTLCVRARVCVCVRACVCVRVTSAVAVVEASLLFNVVFLYRYEDRIALCSRVVGTCMSLAILNYRQKVPRKGGTLNIFLAVAVCSVDI